MPVLQVKQRVPVEPDHVYVIPPNRGIILTWLSAQMREQYGLRVTLHANGVSTAYEDTLRILVFQAVREALFNFVKHAQASIDFEAVNGDTRLTVSDEGEGFSPQLMNDNDGGGGLRNLRHRLNLMGCRLEINSRPGAGTQVIIDIPQNR
jgi:signal transduction histidine kinase